MSTLNFHQLHIFHTVVRLGRFSKAAEELGISQPAVSIQVRELEKSIGAPLLHRTRQGPQLTDTGRTVHGYTQRIFALADEMAEAVNDLQGLRGGRLTIGSSTTPGEYILPWAIGQFQKRYPDVEVSLSISNTGTIIERIKDHELDLGMAGAPVDIEGLASFPYVDDEIAIIASPEHEMAQRLSLALTDLQGQKFIMREEGSATRLTAERCLLGHNVDVKVVMELGSNEAVKRAVAAGLGLGTVSTFGTAPDTVAGMITVLNIDGWECRRPLNVFYRQDTHLPPAQSAFLDFLRDERPLPPSI